MSRYFAFTSLLVAGLSFAQGRPVTASGAPATPPAADQTSEWRPVPPPPPPGRPVEPTAARAAPTPEATDFERELSGYGRWLDAPGLGRVWQPDPQAVGDGFVPYSTGGSWRSTDSGWTFDSNYPWGGVTFHYGRWYLDADHGWLWWPDDDWAPAWVDWRTSGDYVAWAPLGPPGRNVAFTLGVPGWSYVPYHALGLAHVARHQIFPHWNGHHYGWSHSSHGYGGVEHHGAGGHWGGGHSDFGHGRGGHSIGHPGGGSFRGHQGGHSGSHSGGHRGGHSGGSRGGHSGGHRGGH